MIEDERQRQERMGDEMWVWILPAEYNCGFDILREERYIDRNNLASHGGYPKPLGIIGKFEGSVQVDYTQDSILFLTPWWIWHN